MKNDLKNFRGKEIFIDANIFTYHHFDDPKFGSVCTDFLDKVERANISGITSTLIVEETIYVILLGKGCVELNTTKTQRVRERIKKSKDFAKRCYSVVNEFLEYIKFLKETGLRVLEVTGNDIRNMNNAVKYNLLPRDAIIVNLMFSHNIKNLATADTDFERVKTINVWTP